MSSVARCDVVVSARGCQDQLTRQQMGQPMMREEEAERRQRQLMRMGALCMRQRRRRQEEEAFRHHQRHLSIAMPPINSCSGSLSGEIFFAKLSRLNMGDSRISKCLSLRNRFFYFGHV